MSVNMPEVERVARLAAGGHPLLRALPREKLAWMLQKMCEIRYFEEKAEDLYIRGLVHGTMHLSIGQEAAAVGLLPSGGSPPITRAAGKRGSEEMTRSPSRAIEQRINNR